MATESAKRDEQGRMRNLARILGLVHVSASTRSELTRVTGLNRSTIAGLVAELVERELAVEDDASSVGQVGRPSPVVRPSDRPVAIAVNPEIDAITIGAVLLGGRVLSRRRVELSRIPDPDEAVEAITAAVAGLRGELGTGHDVIGLGLAIPGIVRTADSFVRFAPHLGWRDVPLGDRLAETTGLPVQAANDAALGARAEWTFGAGRGVDDLVYVNGGASGIGGGIISQGVPLGGRSGHAGEIGHLSVRRDGDPDSAGLSGTLESEVRRADLLRALGLSSASADQLEDALVASTSADVRATVNDQIDSLALALAGVVTLFDPERIVLGGFLGSLARIDLDRIRHGVDRHALPVADRVDITRARLGSDLLMIGAAELSFENLIRSL